MTTVIHFPTLRYIRDDSWDNKVRVVFLIKVFCVKTVLRFIAPYIHMKCFFLP